MREADEAIDKGRLMLGCMPTTDWRVFVDVGADTPQGRAAVARICETYRVPIYHFVRKRWGAARAGDLTQGFFVHLLETDALTKVEPGRSRLRNWLARAVTNYVRDAHRHDTRQKRGGDAEHVAFDLEQAEHLYLREVGPDMSPEQALDAGLIGQLLRDAQARLREAFVADHGEEQWDLLAPFLHGVDRGELVAVAERLGVTRRRLSGRIATLREILLAYCEAELAALGSEDPRGELRALAGL